MERINLLTLPLEQAVPIYQRVDTLMAMWNKLRADREESCVDVKQELARVKLQDKRLDLEAQQQKLKEELVPLETAIANVQADIQKTSQEMIEAPTDMKVVLIKREKAEQKKLKALVKQQEALTKKLTTTTRVIEALPNHSPGSMELKFIQSKLAPIEKELDYIFGRYYVPR